MAHTEGIPRAFGWIDWSIVAAYFIITTLVGARLSGRQATIRDFFLGGRKLPWWAVSGSIVASEISAATFIAVPAISFAAGGNMTYLQLGIGAVLARIIIGAYFVPRYYEREIYSPYDFMGNQLGPRVRTATTLLFFVGAILGQGARIFVTALLLKEVTGLGLVASIWCISGFGVIWAFIGGITTVIWTDVAQFFILVIGALTALVFAVYSVDGGAGAVISIGQAAGKFQMLDFRWDLALNYTFWMGVLSTPFLNVAAFGLDQSVAQRMFCCRTPRQATIAIISSCVGQVVAVLMLLVGIAIHAYFESHPPTAAEAQALAADPTSVFPIYIVRAIPVGLRGLIVAAVFAASTTSGVLAALSQTTISAFKATIVTALRRIGLMSGRSPNDVAMSKALIIFWGVTLALVAMWCIRVRESYPNAIDLVLALVAYTYAPMLGIFLLAFLPVNRDDEGLLWGLSLSMLVVFGLTVHGSISAGPVQLHADWIIWAGCGTALAAGVYQFRDDLMRVSVVVAAVLAILALHHGYLYSNALGQPVYASPYWSYPVGTLLMFAVGWGIGRPRRGQRAKV